MVQVKLVNNEGGGFHELISVDNDVTISEFLEGRLDKGMNQYKIRLNGQTASYDAVLQEGDRVTCTPLKIEGGA